MTATEIMSLVIYALWTTSGLFPFLMFCRENTVSWREWQTYAALAYAILFGPVAGLQILVQGW